MCVCTQICATDMGFFNDGQLGAVSNVVTLNANNQTQPLCIGVHYSGECNASWGLAINLSQLTLDSILGQEESMMTSDAHVGGV